jgi:hypothetical protein
MTDMVLCYGSADGVGLRAQALYREEILAVQGLRENGTFQRRSVDRCQELTSRMLDLESQILETVEENCQQIPGSCSQHTNFMGKRINILLQNFLPSAITQLLDFELMDPYSVKLGTFILIQ